MNTDPMNTDPMNTDMKSFAVKFGRNNADVIEDGSAFDESLLSEIGSIQSAEDFLRSRAFNDTAKRAFMQTVTKATTTNTSGCFHTQGTTRSITCNGQDTTGHPFDSVPMHLLSFQVFPDKRVEPQTLLFRSDFS